MRVVTMRSEKLFFICKMAAYVLKTIGLAPFSISPIFSTKSDSRDSIINVVQSSKLGLVYNIILFITVLSMAVFMVPQWISAGFSGDPSIHSTMNIVDIIVKSLYIITTCVIILSWGFRQKDAVCIVNRLVEVDTRLSSFGKQPLNKQTLIFVILHVIANAVVWIGYCFISLPFEDFTKLILLSYEVSLIAIIYWFIFQYLAIVSLMARDLKMVNNYFLALAESHDHLSRQPQVQNGHSENTGSSTHDNCLLASVESLHSIQAIIFELCEDIEDFFSLPILFCILAFFVSLVNGFCSVVLPKDGDSPMVEILTTIFQLVVWYCYPIASLAFSVTRIGKEANRTGRIVHKLLAAATKRESIVKLEAVSLQLLHEDISFTAYGCFPIDSTLLVSILGATATYFVVLIQFHQTACKYLPANTVTIDHAISNTTYTTVT